METNLHRIPKVFLNPMMQEAGCLDGRPVENLSFEEKVRRSLFLFVLRSLLHALRLV